MSKKRYVMCRWQLGNGRWTKWHLMDVDNEFTSVCGNSVNKRSKNDPKRRQFSSNIQEKLSLACKECATRFKADSDPKKHEQLN